MNCPNCRRVNHTVDPARTHAYHCWNCNYRMDGEPGALSDVHRALVELNRARRNSDGRTPPTQAEQALYNAARSRKTGRHARVGG